MLQGFLWSMLSTRLESFEQFYSSIKSYRNKTLAQIVFFTNDYEATFEKRIENARNFVSVFHPDKIKEIFNKNPNDPWLESERMEGYNGLRLPAVFQNFNCLKECFIHAFHTWILAPMFYSRSLVFLDNSGFSFLDDSSRKENVPFAHQVAVRWHYGKFLQAVGLDPYSIENYDSSMSFPVFV